MHNARYLSCLYQSRILGDTAANRPRSEIISRGKSSHDRFRQEWANPENSCVATTLNKKKTLIGVADLGANVCADTHRK